MRDSLALALIRAERCRVASAQWAASADTEASDIIEASDLLLRMAQRARQTMCLLTKRRRATAHALPPD